jgi:hypothetical protein
MPETTVHEHGHAQLGENKSGRTKKTRSAERGVRDEAFATRTVLFRAPRSAFRISTCLLPPVMPCARNTCINASSVSLFPRERMRDITPLGLALVKTSGAEFF